MPGLRRVIWLALELLLLVPLALYAAVVAMLWWGQERLLFQPDVLPPDHRFNVPADVHEAWVDVAGARLNALHLRLPKPHGVVFFLHGNAGSLDSWFVNMDYYRGVNLDLFMVDYRGFGKSSGRIRNEAQLHADVRAAWDSVMLQPRYAGLRRIVYGRSLGTGLAAELAAQVAPDLTVLVSPYASMVALAGQHYPWAPRFVLRYPLRSDLALARVKSPLLLVHGGRDTLIPPVNTQLLQAVAPHAQVLLLPDAAHNDLQEFAAYLDGLSAVLMRR